MPEFQLPHGSLEAGVKLTTRDAFTQGYVEAMFFTDASPDSEDCADATVSDLSADAWRKIDADCAKFQADAAPLLALAYERDYDAAQAGRDFWYTRNGHGVGFWDREALEDGGLGDQLSEVAKCYGGANLYRGDDTEMYLI